MSSISNDNLVLRPSTLKVIPNPAQLETQLFYGYAKKKGENRAIVVYDISGRPVDSIGLLDDYGNLILPLDKYAAGYYIVMLKENDEIVQQQKMIVK